VISSVSGLLGDLRHVHLARLRCLRCCPGVAVLTLSGPSHRARGGHVHGSGGRLCNLTNLRSACADSIAHSLSGGDHSAYIPDHGNCTVTTRTLPGMARVRSGQAPAWPLSSDRSVRSGLRIKRDFACTLTRHFPPVLVVLRPQSCLMLEGRTRTLSGPSPDPSPAITPAPSRSRGRGSHRQTQRRAVVQRSGLNAARISVANSSGSSQAAKWPPLLASWK
jgi:hypothetical protein